MRQNGNIFPTIDSTKSAAMFKNRTQYDEPNFKMRLSQNEIQLPQTKKSFSRDSLASMQSMTSKNFIKEFSSKLEKHQYDIEKRDEFIKELELTLEKIRSEYVYEKQISEDKSRQLRESVDAFDKLNIKLKSNQIKMEELISKVQFYEKEISKIKEGDSKLLLLSKTNEEQSAKRAEELEKKLKDLELQKSQSSIKQEQELNRQLQESIAARGTIKLELDGKLEELKRAKELIQKYEEERQLVEHNISHLKRSSTMKLQELESKNKDLESNQAKTLSQLKEDNLKMSGDVKALKQQNDELNFAKVESTAEIQKLTKTNQTLIDNVQQMKNENETLQKQLIEQKQQITSLEGILTQKNEKMTNMLKELENTRNKSNSNDKSAAENKQLLSNLQKKYDDSTQSLTSLQSQLSTISKCSRKLEEAEKEITKSLKCNFCDQFIKDPITIIPCGHSFCLNCKKAYAKDCIRCGPKVKVEAMYRNELLDDIIGMVKIMQSLQQSLKS